MQPARGARRPRPGFGDRIMEVFSGFSALYIKETVRAGM
jgi:hypothetical protein